MIWTPIKWAFYAGAGAVLLPAAGCGAKDASGATDSSPQPVPVRCIEVAPAIHRVCETFYGIIEPRTKVDLAFEVGGRVVRIGASAEERLDGARVAAGAELASIDSTRYLAAEQEARARVDSAQAERRTAATRVANAQVLHQDAVDELSRRQQMFDQSAASTRELNRSQVAVEFARLELESATSQLDSAAAAHAAALANLELAQANLRDTVLRSPIAGQVAMVHVQSGEMISPMAPVVTVMEIDRVKLVIGVAERKLPLIQEGQLVHLEVPALGGAAGAVGTGAGSQSGVVGRVTLVPAAADSRSGLFNVEVEAPNADGRMRPGMIAKAVVTIAEVTAIAIPPEAVINTGRSAWYFQVEGADDAAGRGANDSRSGPAQAARARRVAIHPSQHGEGYLVFDRSQRSMRLIVEGQHRLFDGQPVTLLHDSNPASNPHRVAAESGAPR